MKLTARS